MDNNSLPKILIITDAVPIENGRGAAQTTYNLFKNYPVEKLFLCVPQNHKDISQLSLPFERHIVETFSKIPLLHNRIGKYINEYIQLLNCIIYKKWPVVSIKKIKAFAPDIVLTIPIGNTPLFVSQWIKKQISTKNVIYIMDNWFPYAQQTVMEQKTLLAAREMLQSSDGWMMISEALGNTLNKNFNTKKNFIVVHNPVDETIIMPVKHVGKDVDKPFRICYAGSIWPMHLNAIELIAEAVKRLRDEQVKIELVLYTPQEFYSPYKERFENWEVRYGGNIPYKKIHALLAEGDLCLVAATFDEQWGAYSKSSVQTKITDYMACGVTILSVGPESAANNAFIKQHDCGYVIDESNIENAYLQIREIMSNPEQNLRFSMNAHALVKQHFTKDQVCHRLYSFLSKVYSTNLDVESF